MQVLAPSDFSRMVFAACGRPQNIQLFHQPRMKVSHPPVQHFFHSPFAAQIAPPMTVQHLTHQVQLLEREVQRMSDELKFRVNLSRRERSAREALKQECAELREEVGRVRSVLHAREREIYDLERQLRASQTQLVLLKRKHAAASAAISAKGSPAPGSISSLPKEIRSIGTQVDEITDLEGRIDRLTEALMVEKRRNQRIKSLMVSEPDAIAVPPIPSYRAVSLPPVRTQVFSTQSLAGAIIHRPVPRFTKQSFLEINANSAPPPVINSRGTQIDPAMELRTVSPVLLSPIKRVNNSVQSVGFNIFEDQENALNGRIEKMNFGASAGREVFADAGMVQRANRVPVVDLESPAVKKSSSQRLQPPPFVPQLNLQAVSPAVNTSTASSSSETAIKRAVAAAIEKRRMLASQGVSLGSARSGSSFMSNSPINVSSIKARFCLPLG
jgi:hypothetical protein